MRILILGGYGLIGLSVVRHLLVQGHQISGLGRNTTAAARQLPGVQWVEADMSALVEPGSWNRILQQTRPEIIVNCAGALQDGLRDTVASVHFTSIKALIGDCEKFGIRHFIQISAAGASLQSNTTFMRTKAQADSALQDAEFDWTIFRPGLVLAEQAYGGSALLHALAAFPIVQPVAFAGRPIQTVSATDIAIAVEQVILGKTQTGTAYDLVEEKPHTLAETLSSIRSWMGLAPAQRISIPVWLIKTTACCADMLGWLGWRSPLRSTAIAELDAGVTGNPAPWRAQTGQALNSLSETLGTMPATIQIRTYARIFFLKPVIIATLCLFWLLSGIIALANVEAAIHVFTSRSLSAGLAAFTVYAGITADIAVGCAIVVKKTSTLAAKAMIAITLAYLAGGTILMPDLWADPLGPLVKAIPAMMLALTALALADER